MMDVYEARRAFLVEEQRRQHIIVESTCRELDAAIALHVSDPERMPLSRVELKSGQLHDEQAVENYLGRTLAAYPVRPVTEVA